MPPSAKQFILVILKHQFSRKFWIHRGLWIFHQVKRKETRVSLEFSTLIWCLKVAVLSLTVMAVPWVYFLLFPCAIPYWGRWKLCLWEVSKIRNAYKLIASLVKLYKNQFYFKKLPFHLFFHIIYFGILANLFLMQIRWKTLSALTLNPLTILIFIMTLSC